MKCLYIYRHISDAVIAVKDSIAIVKIVHNVVFENRFSKKSDPIYRKKERGEEREAEVAYPRRLDSIV